MENAVDALKIGFAVLVFTMALSLSMYMFTEAKTTADAVLHRTDETYYMEYDQAQLDHGTIIGTGRVVGLETIIPTLYKYRKENFIIIFRDKDGNLIPLYETQTTNWSDGYINKYVANDNSKLVYAFDVDDETRRHEPWTGSAEEYKNNLDAFINGDKYTYSTSNAYGGSTQKTYDYSRSFVKGSFMEQYKETTFIENLGEYEYSTKTSGNTSVKNKKKRIIIYTEI